MSTAVSSSIPWARVLGALFLLVLLGTHARVGWALVQDLPALLPALGTETEATVTEQYKIYNRSTRSAPGRVSSSAYTYFTHHLVFRYEVDGETVMGRDQVSEDVYEAHDEGAAIAVRYMNGLPGLSVVAEDGDFNGWNYLAAVVALAAIDAGVIAFITRRRRRAAA